MDTSQVLAASRARSSVTLLLGCNRAVLAVAAGPAHSPRDLSDPSCQKGLFDILLTRQVHADRYPRVCSTCSRDSQPRIWILPPRKLCQRSRRLCAVMPPHGAANRRETLWDCYERAVSASKARARARAAWEHQLASTDDAVSKAKAWIATKQASDGVAAQLVIFEPAGVVLLARSTPQYTLRRLRRTVPPVVAAGATADVLWSALCYKAKTVLSKALLDDFLGLPEPLC